MKKKIALVLALFGSCLIAGCFPPNTRLYLVQGPLASQAHPPFFTGEAHWIFFSGFYHSGHVTVALANGEVFQGPWKSLSAKSRAKSGSADTPIELNLSSAWDLAYGNGFYTANVQHSPDLSQSILNGDQGTVLETQIYQEQEKYVDCRYHQCPIRGVAKDDKGNIYKIVFE